MSACVDITSDEQNCGECGVECPAQTSCVSKVCRCDQAGRTLCPDEVCYDLTTNPDHCGSCTNDCGGNYSCIASKCACPDPVVGPEVRVTNHSYDDHEPVVAWDGNHVGLAYRSVNVTIPYLRFFLLNPDGTKFADNAFSQQVSLSPSIVWSGTEYAIATKASSSAQLFRFDATATALGPAQAVANTMIDFVKLAWSAPYGGYGWAYTAGSGSYNLGFQRLGVNGTSPETGHSFSVDHNAWSSPLVVGPDGSWALAFDEDDGTRLAVFNPDGSLTQPVVELASAAPGRPGLAFDGTTFLTAYPQYSGSIHVNRGTTKNTPAVVFSSGTDQLIGDVYVVMVNGTVVLGWTQRNNTSSNNPAYRLRLQRFALPTDSSSNLRPIGNVIDVTSSTHVGGYLGAGLVATGPQSLLAVWADNRLGATSREIYARPIDLKGCP